jgi:hypothetical protein
MIIGNNTQVNQKMVQTSVKKQETAEPKDGFEKSESKDLGYVDNLKHSTLGGFAAGFIKVGNAVEHVMPSYNGEDHMGLHLLCAVPPIVAGTVAGVFGGAAGLVMGLFGGNITNHIEVPQT